MTNDALRPARLLALAAVLAAPACGGSGSGAIAEDFGGAEADSSLIIGAIDWTEVTELAADGPERANSYAVGYVSMPTARCTGFLVAPDVVMTNQHCITSANDAIGVTVSFRRELGVLPASWATYDCSTFLGNDAALDYALLRCAGSPGSIHGVVELEPRDARARESIYVIHQNCDWATTPDCEPNKKYSPGRILSGGNELAHDADTLGGSSGSPVFSPASHAVLAIHHAGSGDDGHGRGSQNWAVPMSRIVPELRRRFPTLALGRVAPNLASQSTQATSDPAKETPADVPDAILEPNDALQSATKIALPFSTGALAISSATDEDWYSFDSDGGDRSLHLDFLHAAGDLDLYVYAADGTELAKSITTTDQEAVAQPFAPGPIFVRVIGYRGATGTYRLSIQ